MSAVAPETESLEQPMEKVGYRSWTLCWNGELRSLGKGAITWMPGENVAQCAHGFDHRAPDARCDCGLYAHHRASERMACEDEIRGAVVASGDLHVYRDGFRAERARVVALVRARGADRRRRAAEQAASKRYGVRLVDAHELETVASEHGEPVDPVLIARLRTPVVPVAREQRARTRREIRIERTYDAVAERSRAVPGLRTLLLCLRSYGLAVSLYLWALLGVHWAHHPVPGAIIKGRRPGGYTIHAGVMLKGYLLPLALVALPALAAWAITRARRLAAAPLTHLRGHYQNQVFRFEQVDSQLLSGSECSRRCVRGAAARTGEVPLLARSGLALMLAAALALPWLPRSSPAVIAGAWLIGIAAGTVLFACVHRALTRWDGGPFAWFLPGLVAVGVLAHVHASTQALVAAGWVGAHLAILSIQRNPRWSR